MLKEKNELIRSNNTSSNLHSYTIYLSTTKSVAPSVVSRMHGCCLLIFTVDWVSEERYEREVEISDSMVYV